MGTEIIEFNALNNSRNLGVSAIIVDSFGRDQTNQSSDKQNFSSTVLVSISNGSAHVTTQRNHYCIRPCFCSVAIHQVEQGF